MWVAMVTWRGEGLLAAGCDSSGSLLLEDGPIKHIVILVVQRAEEDAEKLPQVHVVWGLLKAQASAVVQIHCKFSGVALGKDRHSRSDTLYIHQGSCEDRQTQ